MSETIGNGANRAAGVTAQPIDTLRQENATLRELLARLRARMAYVAGDSGEGAIPPWRAEVDEARLLVEAGERAAKAIEEMIAREEETPFPVCLDAFTRDDLAEIREGLTGEGSSPAGAPEEVVRLPTGWLSLAQLAGLFDTLPVDITYVDAGDRVVFFSGGRGRIFSRSEAILGHKVQQCHRAESREVVNRILDDFRRGRQSVAEFWMGFMGRMVHTRFLAVRDEGGGYLGTLEMTQDIGPLQRLSGERRLLEYEGGAGAVEEKNATERRNGGIAS
ncbi:MAG: DUF438 domain-containing protein [Bryobacterales bacterium]|nr:DUF438 domain-containing protein [Bryobacterales bacterium]